MVVLLAFCVGVMGVIMAKIEVLSEHAPHWRTLVMANPLRTSNGTIAFRNYIAAESVALAYHLENVTPTNAKGYYAPLLLRLNPYVKMKFAKLFEKQANIIELRNVTTSMTVLDDTIKFNPDVAEIMFSGLYTVRDVSSEMVLQRKIRTYHFVWGLSEAGMPVIMNFYYTEKDI